MKFLSIGREVADSGQVLATFEVPGVSQKLPQLLYRDRIFLRNAKYPSMEFHAAVFAVHGDQVTVAMSYEVVQLLRGNQVKVHMRFAPNRVKLRRAHAAIAILRNSSQRRNQMLLPTGSGDVSETGAPMFTLGNLELVSGVLSPWIAILIFAFCCTQQFDKRLNSQQKSAICKMLNGEAGVAPVLLLGAAGSGKTETIIELALQICKWNKNCRKKDRYQILSPNLHPPLTSPMQT